MEGLTGTSRSKVHKSISKHNCFCPPAASSPPVTDADNISDFDDYYYGKVTLQHIDVGEQLARNDKQGALHYGSIRVVRTWRIILLRRLTYHDFDDYYHDELNPTKLQECRTLYQTVSQDDPLNVKQKTTSKSKTKSPAKQKPKPKPSKKSNKRSLQQRR